MSRSPHHFFFLRDCAGYVIIAASFFALEGRKAGASEGSNKPPAPLIVDLRSDVLPIPLKIPGDTRDRELTSIEIRGEIAGEGDGKGALVWDESEYEFNDFGDPTPVTRARSAPCEVSLLRIEPKVDRLSRIDENDDRKVYAIVFADGSFADQLRLVISTGAYGPHRLLIAKGAGERRDREFHLWRIIELHGLPEIAEPLPDAPLRSTFDLQTLSTVHAKHGNMHRVNLRGEIEGEVSLDLDPNILGFNEFGSVTRSTLIGSTDVKTSLTPIDARDPTKKGRRLFEVFPDGKGLPASYFLVLAPTEAGPHRLLIRNGEKLVESSRLDSYQRRTHLALEPKLAETSPEERQAIAALRNAIGYSFRFVVKERRLVELSITGGDCDLVDPILTNLKNLRVLNIGESRLGAKGLPSLSEMPNLEILGINHSEIDNRGLASLKSVAQLRALSLRESRGLNDEGMRHVAELESLKHLTIYSEAFLRRGASGEGTITDAGLEQICGLTNLESLTFVGQKITDTGLAQLRSLGSLESLTISGEGITDAGVEHLEALMKLQSLHLIRTQITPAGKETLKAKLPQGGFSE